MSVSQHDLSFPRLDSRPGSANSLAPFEKRAQGKPGADCARSPMCVGVLQKCTRVKPQVQPGHPGFPRAMALRLIRALPGEAAVFATVVSGKLAANVAPGSQRQDHTTSPYDANVSPGAKAPDATASIATRANVP